MADPSAIQRAKNQITQGALNSIFNDPDNVNADFPVPILQCVQIKVLGAQGDGNPERYRIVLSDVHHFVQSMLATQANHIVHDGKLKKGSVVRVKSYQANSVKGKRILIILDLEVIEELGEMEKIGEPTALEAKEGQDMKPTNTTISNGGFYGAAAPVKKENSHTTQDRGLTSRAAPSNSSSHATIYPIEGLSPYAHKWTIKARVTAKSDIRTWQKPNSEGKLFSVNLLDESGEIKATGFNDQCDMLYDQFQVGSVYYISAPCKVQMAKKNFTNLPNDYELTFERDTVVEKAEESEGVPQVRYNFTNISALQEVDKDATIDIICVLKEVAEMSQIVSKSTQKPYDKRELTVVDDTGFSVKLTIWGKTATSFDAQVESVVAFKGVKVSDFGGRSLSLLSSGQMSVDPDIPEAHKLKGWYDSQGRTEAYNSHSNMSGAGAAGGRQDPLKTVAQIKDEGLGMNETPDYFSIKATISYIKSENFSYPACLKIDCNKKVNEVDDGWRCEKCDITHDRPQHRYIMSLSANDHTGQLYLSCFDDIGQLVMGMTADDLMALQDSDNEKKERVFQEAICKTFTFKCRAKMDSFQDQQRIRYQVMTAMPLDYVREARKLTELIKLYNID